MKNGLDSNTRFLIFTFLALMLSGCTAEPTPRLDGGQVSTLETRVAPPLVAPSIENGQSSFTQNCLSCHLQSGAVSDTETGGTNLISLDWLKQTTPTQMFTALTTGNPDRGMPSFTSLPSGERWNLVAYLLSLVSPQSDQSGSKLIYQNMCQSCHGSSGAGDGTQALSKNLSLSDWQSNPLLVDYSNEELFYTIRGGNAHGMGTFAVMLSESQLWSLVTTARALSVSSSPASASTQIDSGQPVVDKVASAQGQGFITIEGSISNGSGGKLDDLSGLNLTITRPGLETQNMVAAVGHDNTFRFVLVPYSPDWNYSAEISHNGIVYKSVRFSGQSTSVGATVPLAIKVYDSSTDTAALRAERLHVLLNFQTDHMIHVTESFLIRNPSSYTILPADDQTPLLHFMLSPDATNITVDQYSQSQFLKVLNGKLGDWQPILPGGVHQVMFEYDLPFENERNFEFNAPVQVISTMIMIENQNKDITCSGMQLSNQQMAMSESLLIFSSGIIDAGNKLVLHCLNKKEIFPEIIGALVLLAALLVVILIPLANRKKQAFSEGKVTKKTTLLDAIITLDDQFKAGEIQAEVYNAKREELIKKLGGE